MANFQVLDAYGSVITIQSSTFSGAERQAVAAYIMNAGSVSGTVGVSVIGAVNINPASVQVLNPVSLLAVNPNPSSVWVINPNQSVSGQIGASIIGLTPVNVVSMPGVSVTSVLSIVPVEITRGSIAGTYSEDSAHATTDKGIFTLAVRNDAVASFVSADLEYSAKSVDSAGRTLVKPFAPEQSRIEGTISLTSTSITTVIAAAGAGLRNYVTDFFIANPGSVTTLVTFKDGAGSVLGYTIAPATGGSNAPGFQTPIRTGVNATFDIQATNPTSTLYATFTGFKAP